MIRPKQAYIWGHPYGTHTHSHVHYGYRRAFEALGIQAVHVDGREALNVKPGSIILTEGNVDSQVPVRPDLYYVLHNCNREKYASVYDHCVHLGVLAKFSGSTDGFEKPKPWAYWDKGTRTLFQPWATNLLPGEIDYSWVDLPRRPLVHYVGTVISVGSNNNWPEVVAFAQATARRGIQFHAHGGYTGEGASQGVFRHHHWPDEKHHQLLIQESWVAPTLLGQFQRDNAYIPCRCFKNVSFGQALATNSAAVRDFFPMGCVYSEDCGKLFELYASMSKQAQRAMCLEQMKWVKENHTFINRVLQVLEVM